MQRVTRGSALVGKLYGTIVADAGSITSTEIAAKGVSAANLALANTKIAIGSTAGGGVAYALTGDVTMSNGGVTAIGAKKVLATMTAIANTKVLVGSTGGVGVAYALSGDVTMSNAGAVTIGAKKVVSTMVSESWSALTNTTKSTVTKALPAALGGYLFTKVGSSKGCVIASAKLSKPLVGDHYKVFLANAPSTMPIHIKSTAATFDGTNKFVLLNAVGDGVSIEAATTTRWVVSGGVGYVLAATT